MRIVAATSGVLGIPAFPVGGASQPGAWHDPRLAGSPLDVEVAPESVDQNLELLVAHRQQHEVTGVRRRLRAKWRTLGVELLQAAFEPLPITLRSRSESNRNEPDEEVHRRRILSKRPGTREFFLRNAA